MAFFKGRLGQVLHGRNLFILLLTGALFYGLYSYRQNDPLPVSHPAPDMQLTTVNNESFRLHEIWTPVILVFYSERKFGANNIYPGLYSREMPHLRFLQEEGLAQVVIVAKGVDTPEKLRQFLAKDKYRILEGMVFALTDQQVAAMYGVRSWPHVFVLDSGHRVRYSAKIMSAGAVNKTIGGLNNGKLF